MSRAILFAIFVKRNYNWTLVGSRSCRGRFRSILLRSYPSIPSPTYATLPKTASMATRALEGMGSPPRKKLRARRGGVPVPLMPSYKSLLSMVPSSLNSTRNITEPEKQSPLELLPDEVLGKCFFSGFVDSIDIINRVKNVSKRTLAVANKSVKMLDLRALPKLEASHVASIARRHGNVSSLDFGYCPQFGRAHLMALVPISETLRSLRLRGSSLRDNDIVAYLNAVTNHLGGPSLLEEIDLSAIKKEETNLIGDEAVSEISDDCPELRTLTLGWCKGVTDKCLPKLKNLRRLKELDLSLTSVTDNGCGELAKIQELQKLDLSATGVGNAGIRDLVGLKTKRAGRLKLQALCLRFNEELTEESLLLLAARMPTLEALDIRHCQLDTNVAKETFQLLKRNGTKVEGGL